MKRSYLFFLYCAAIFFMSCSHSFNEKNNFYDYSKKIPPEAEQYFAQASLLWKQEHSLPKFESETCSNPLDAITLLNKALSIEPAYADALVRRAMAKRDTKDFSGAFDDISLAIRLQPIPKNYAIRALISLTEGSLMAAHKDLQYSLQLDSKQTEAWNYLAMLDILEDRDESACKNFRNACKNGDCTRLEVMKNNNMCRD